MKNTFNYKTAFRILKGGKVSMVVSAFLAGATMSFASPATNALPTQGNVVNGNVNISTNANTMNINQASNKSIINWNTYNIGKDSTVNYNFAQTNSSSLNRVTSNNPSEIYGNLNANGKVILVNPNGVVFGKESSVNVGSLVATTMNVKDADYLNDKDIYTRDNAIGSIVNEGTITAQEKGYIALLSPKVLNEGVIRAVKGTVSLAGADKIELTLDSSGLKTIIVEPSTIQTLIENKSLVEADGGLIYIGVKQVEQLLDTAMNLKNSGILQANSINELLGKVDLNGNSIEVSGTVQAKNGEIYVGHKDVEKTTIKSNSVLEANFIETSGKVLNLEDKVNIKANKWLVDPTDLTIDSSNISTYNSGIASADTLIITDGTLYINDVLTVNAHKLSISSSDIVFGMPSNFSGFTGKINIGSNGSLNINENDYFIVRNQADLNTIKNNAGSTETHFAIGNDLTLASWTGNINSFGGSSRPFLTLNGLGHSISGISGTQGLFSTTQSANITGIMIETPSISSSSSNIGALIGTATDTIVKNSYVHGGSVTSTDALYGANIGGLIGQISGDTNTLSNLGSSATVSGASTVGGLIGQAKFISGTNLVATGNVTGTKSRIGGLIGALEVCSTINDSHATGSVTKSGADSSWDNIGGLVGNVLSSSNAKGFINNSYATGTITSSTASSDSANGDNIGGLVGLAESELYITNSYSTSAINASGQKNVGGIIGYVKSGASVLQRSYYTGSSISGGDNTGGLVGSDGTVGSINIKNNYVITSISGADNVGGIMGNMQSQSKIYHNYSISSISATGTNKGGILGSGSSSLPGFIIGSYYSTTAFSGEPTSNGAWNGNSHGLGSKKTTSQLDNATARAALNYYGDGTSPLSDDDISTNTVYTWGESQAWGSGNLALKATKTCPTCENPTGTFDLSASLSALAGVTKDELDDSTWGLSNITATSNDSTVIYNTDYKMQLLSGTTVLADSKTSTNWTDSYLDALLPGIYTLRVVSLTGGTAPTDATVKITAPVYVKASDGTSIYGDSPVFAYNLYDRAGSALSGVTLTGTAVNSVAGSSSILPSNTASIGDYTYQYTSGLTHGYYIPQSYSVFDNNANINATWTITPRPINITVSKSYDGSVDFTSGYVLSTTAGHNVVNGDTVNAIGALKTTSANANISPYTKSGSTILTDGSLTLALNNSNYIIDGISATINKASLKVIAEDKSKIYDKQTFITSGGTYSYIFDGFVGGETAFSLGVNAATVSFAGTSSAAIDAGTYTISVSNLTKAGGLGSALDNYSLVYQAGDLTINKKSLALDASTLGSISVNDKIYDGNTSTSASTLSGLHINPTDGVLSGDSVNISGLSIMFPDRNVGNDKTLIGSITSGSGTGYQNYDISLTGLTASITPKEVTLNATKVYDGTTNMAGCVTIGGLVSGETLNYTALANDKNVVGATYINAITLTNGTGATTTTGGLASNYKLPSLLSADATKNTATITPKTVTLNATKVYDSTTDMTAYTTVSTGISGEELTFTNATVNNKNVVGASYISAITLANGTGDTGGLASNYSANTTGANANNRATITSKSITLSAVKTYDGTRTLTGSQITMNGLIGSETLTYINAKTNDKDVRDATYITDITLANGTNGGISSNYSLPSLTSSAANINTATINKASLKVIAEDKSKTYDKTIYSGGYTYEYNGFITGENATITGITGTVSYSGTAIAAINAGTYGIIAGGLDASAATNYELSYVDGALTINKKMLTITSSNLTGLGGVDDKVYDGSVLAANKTGLTYSLDHNINSALVPDDTFTITGLTLNFVDKNVGTGKNLIVSSFNAEGADYLNYDVSVTGLTASITQKEVTLNATKVYDGTTDMTGHVTIGGLIGTETLNYTGATANNKNVVGATYINAITLTNGTGATSTTGGLASNYKIPSLSMVEGKNTATITPKALTASLTGEITKVYDSTVDYNSLTNSNFVLSGFIGSESARVTKTSGTYNDKDVLDANSVTASLVNSDFTANGSTVLSNYSLPITASGDATITKKTVGLSATKVYDGNSNLTGKVTINTGIDNETLTYSNAMASDKNVATSGKYINSITLENGTADINNYQLPTLNASNASVTITQKEVTLDATKVYDGTTDMTGHVTIGGLVETETLNYTGATANNKNVEGATYINAITLTNGTGATSTAGGLASNYMLPSLLSVNVTKNKAIITPKALTASLTGEITKVYDGTIDYNSLTNSNFVLSGLIGNENATITKTSGTYNDKNVLDANSMTSLLTYDDFIANNNTLLSNYILPTHAHGSANITPRTITYVIDNKTILLGTKMVDNWPEQAFADMTPEIDKVSQRVYDNNEIDVTDKAIVGNLTPKRYTLKISMRDPNFTLATTGNKDGILTVLSPADPITISTNVFNGSTNELFKPKDITFNETKVQKPSIVQVISEQGKVIDDVNIKNNAIDIKTDKKELVFETSSGSNPFSNNDNISVVSNGLKSKSLENTTKAVEFSFGTATTIDLNNKEVVSPKLTAKVDLKENLNFSFTVKEAVAITLNIKDVIDASAKLSNGASLPSWLKFDKATQTFIATNPPAGSLPLTTTVTVIGVDGKSASMNVEITK